MKCKVDGCARKAEYITQQLCRAHYQQLRKHGAFLMKDKFKPNKIVKRGDKAWIILTDAKGMESERAVIDAEDIERVTGMVWFWGQTAVQGTYKGKTISLGRFLLRPRKGQVVIYRDKDYLNNRKSNLLKGTKQQRAVNSKTPLNNTSGQKGVYWVKGRSKWTAKLQKKGKVYRAKYYDTFEEALEARQELERKHQKNLML